MADYVMHWKSIVHALDVMTASLHTETFANFILRRTEQLLKHVQFQNLDVGHPESNAESLWRQSFWER